MVSYSSYNNVTQLGASQEQEAREETEGEKMAALGREHQVVAITHFPQVAALASQHFLVHKKVAKGRTLSLLQEVAGEARVEELMRMLGGESAEARSMAQSLLGG